ncbi:hypothetical protein ACJX0J_025921, partial [Zea mays]
LVEHDLSLFRANFVKSQVGQFGKEEKTALHSPFTTLIRLHMLIVKKFAKQLEIDSQGNEEECLQVMLDITLRRRFIHIQDMACLGIMYYSPGRLESSEAVGKHVHTKCTPFNLVWIFLLGDLDLAIINYFSFFFLRINYSKLLSGTTLSIGIYEGPSLPLQLTLLILCTFLLPESLNEVIFVFSDGNDQLFFTRCVATNEIVVGIVTQLIYPYRIKSLLRANRAQQIQVRLGALGLANPFLHHMLLSGSLPNDIITGINYLDLI